MPDGWQSRAMCCEGTEALGLPAEVIEALSRYRRLLDQREWDWGDDQVEYFRWERFSQLGPVLEAFAATGDWPSAVRSVIDHDVPAGVVVVRVDAGGGLRAEVGPARTTIPGRTVPAESLRVACARGIEFERAELDVRPAAGETRTVECDPRRLFDPAADGWYGGDLHVHMNYSGDLICTPGDAARMQLGEGLHLANLVAANCLTSLVYDRDMLERFAGADLPWSTDDMVARMGVEYRNDLFGHVHALGPSEPPARYYTGHERSDHPWDWPPNKVACEELRGLGATVGYCFSHLGTASNPPGWGRVYARLGDQALSVPAFKDAIRAGRTVVTNGPWLVLEVNGQGPGAVLDLAVGGRLDLRACVRGPGAERLTLVGPDGVMAEGDAASELRLETTLRDGPTWIPAVARGAGHPGTLDRSVLAHTSPVYVDVAGQRVARVADARWCLELLDTLERFAVQHGHLDPATRAADLGDLVAVLEAARSFYRRVAEAAPR